MRLERSKFVELCFHKTSYDDVIGFFKNGNSRYYWWGGYSRVYGNIKF